MSGQSITDRINAAKYSLSGQGLARIVCKATTEEFNAPKKKHVDYLIQCTNEPNVSIPQMANLLIERVHGRDWIVVYKSLITIHNLINFGNERFTQYLASNNCSFQLDNFCDKNAPQASHMFKFISRYSKYIHRKCYSYRMEGYDFCKVKRGKDDGVLRAMNGEKLLKTLPILQSQLEGLLDFDASVSDLGNNSIIYACFILLFKDLIRLFACYNDGIINLLETYFEMNKKQCKEALDIYKRFLVGMERVSGFLKLAENMGVDKGDIPDLAKAPASLLEALESHLQSLDGKMGSTTPTGQNRPAGFASAIDNFTKASGDVSTSISEDERRKALEEENRTLSIFNQKAGSPSGITASTNPFASAASNKSPTQNGSARPIDDLLGLSGPTNPFDATSQSGPASAFLTDDLFSSAPAGKPQGAFAFGAPVPSTFQDSAFTSESKAHSPFHENSNMFAATGAGAFYGAPQRGVANSPTRGIPPTQSPSHRPNTGPTGFAGASTNPWATQSNQQRPAFQGNAEINFDKGFGFNTQPSTNASSFDAFGPVITPTNPTAPTKAGSESKLIKEDLDASLASIVGNLGMGPGVQMKKEHQWTASPNRGMLTGGATWTPAAPPTKAAPNTLGWGQPQQPGMNLSGLQPSPISASSTVHNPFLITQAQPANQNPTKPIDPFDSLLN